MKNMVQNLHPTGPAMWILCHSSRSGKCRCCQEPGHCEATQRLELARQELYRLCYVSFQPKRTRQPGGRLQTLVYLEASQMYEKQNMKADTA